MYKKPFKFNSFREEFRYLTKNIVLATGGYDRPNLLSVPGEDLPFVFHSLKDFEGVLASDRLRNSNDPVKGTFVTCILDYLKSLNTQATLLCSFMTIIIRTIIFIKLLVPKAC